MLQRHDWKEEASGDTCGPGETTELSIVERSELPLAHRRKQMSEIWE